VFDFQQLVQDFDQAMAAALSVTPWSAQASLDGAYLQGSDTSALGGDLAYRYADLYGSTQGYGDLGWAELRDRIAGTGGERWQTLTVSSLPLVNPWTALQAGTSLILEQPTGAASPITPVAPLTQDALVIAALNSQAQLSALARPTWL
jgi:hypothetical protein